MFFFCLVCQCTFISKQTSQIPSLFEIKHNFVFLSKWQELRKKKYLTWAWSSILKNKPLIRGQWPAFSSGLLLSCCRKPRNYLHILSIHNQYSSPVLVITLSKSLGREMARTLFWLLTILFCLRINLKKKVWRQNNVWTISLLLTDPIVWHLFMDVHNALLLNPNACPNLKTR